MSSDIKQRLLYRNASTPQDAALDDLAIARIEALEGEVARLRAALVRIRDCDWVITLPDRMDAVREIAREALEGTEL